MRRVNINRPEFNLTQEQPGYSWRAAELGPAIGAARMGATLYELPPGEASFPYHYEYGCEEWLLLVSGSATLRDPDRDHALAAGDLVCFPEGPDGGHRVVNTGDVPARMVIFRPRAGRRLRCSPTARRCCCSAAARATI